MKRTLAFSAFLFLGSLASIGQSAPAQRFERGERFENRLLDEVVKMSRAELPEATIVAYVRSRRARLGDDVSADDLIRLRRLGVSDKVVTYIASLAGIGYHSMDRTEDRDRERDSDRDRDRDRDHEVTYDGDDSSVAALDPPYSGGYGYPFGWSSVYDPYPWWGDPYPYWYAYSPFFFGGISFRGGGRFHGGRGDGRGRHTGDGHHGGNRDRGSLSDSGSSGASHGSSRGGSHSGGSHGGGHSGGGGGHGRR